MSQVQTKTDGGFTLKDINSLLELYLCPSPGERRAYIHSIRFMISSSKDENSLSLGNKPHSGSRGTTRVSDLIQISEARKLVKHAACVYLVLIDDIDEIMQMNDRVYILAHFNAVSSFDRARYLGTSVLRSGMTRHQLSDIQHYISQCIVGISGDLPVCMANVASVHLMHKAFADNRYGLGNSVPVDVATTILSGDE